MKCICMAITLLISLHLSFYYADAQNEEKLEAYYFFSPACPRCEHIAPFIKELSRVIRMRGFVFGKGYVEPIPFEVGQADKVTFSRYGVHAFPSLAVMKNDAVKQLFSGEQDIKDALILSAYRKGA
jgi:thiol-disulfide isomerase/thioredoxin